jgi:hypothetical protein
MHARRALGDAADTGRISIVCGIAGPTRAFATKQLRAHGDLAHLLLASSATSWSKTVDR